MIPTLEALEVRLLPAQSHLIIVDFTPDPTPDHWHPAPFFRPWQRGEGFDMDGNGTINLADAFVAEQQVVRRVRHLFAGLGWEVKGVDWTYQSNAGLRWLRKGLADPSALVQVVYVGDTAPPGQGGELLGLAYQAGLHSNLEAYCYVFGAPATGFPPPYIGGIVGDGAAHEIGHLNGLQHPRNTQDFLDVMNAWGGDDFAHIAFSRRWKRVEGGTLQNAWQELQAGWNQPSIGLGGLTYF